MKKVDVNHIVFCPEGYKDEDEYDMWKDIINTERILLKNGYHCKVWTEGSCTCIDYANPELCDNTLTWMDLDDLELLESLEQDLEEGKVTFNFD